MVEFAGNAANKAENGPGLIIKDNRSVLNRIFNGFRFTGFRINLTTGISLTERITGCAHDKLHAIINIFVNRALNAIVFGRKKIACLSKIIIV